MPKIVHIALTVAQRQSITHKYKVETHPKMKERYQMLLLSSKGKSISEVAETVGKTIWTVSDMLHAFEKEGLQGLALKPQPGNHRKLTPAQRREVQRLLKRSPKAYGYPTSYWSVQWVRTLVKERCSVLYAKPDSYRALLYESAFSFHRPGKKYREQDPEKVRLWLKDIKKN